MRARTCISPSLPSPGLGCQIRLIRAPASAIRPKRLRGPRFKRSRLNSIHADSSKLRWIRFCVPFCEPTKHEHALLGSIIAFEVETAVAIVICDQTFAGRIAGALTYAHTEFANRLEQQALISNANVEIPKESLRRGSKRLTGSISAAIETGFEPFDAG